MSDGWVRIPGFHEYAVNKLGEVLSIKKNIILKQQENYGYLHVTLYKDKKAFYKRAHRLILLAFVGYSNLYVNHIDGNKKNNNLNNLEYVTHSENMKHAFRIGLRSMAGSDNNRSKFLKEDILDIKQKIANGVKNKTIAVEYGVDPSLISHIKRGYTYAKK